MSILQPRRTEEFHHQTGKSEKSSAIKRSPWKETFAITSALPSTVAIAEITSRLTHRSWDEPSHRRKSRWRPLGGSDPLRLAVFSFSRSINPYTDETSSRSCETRINLVSWAPQGGRTNAISKGRFSEPKISSVSHWFRAIEMNGGWWQISFFLQTSFNCLKGF